MIPLALLRTHRERSTYETFGGHISGGQTTWGLVAVNDHPRGVVLHLTVSISLCSFHCIVIGGKAGKIRTIWFNRFAAPKPVGPAPMTRTSTELFKEEKQHVSYPFDKTILPQHLHDRSQVRGKEGLVTSTYMSGWVILP